MINLTPLADNATTEEQQRRVNELNYIAIVMKARYADVIELMTQVFNSTNITKEIVLELLDKPLVDLPDVLQEAKFESVWKFYWELRAKCIDVCLYLGLTIALPRIQEETIEPLTIWMMSSLIITPDFKGNFRNINVLLVELVDLAETFRKAIEYVLDNIAKAPFLDAFSTIQGFFGVD